MYQMSSYGLAVDWQPAMTVENGEGMLDKEATSHDDLFDSFRLSLIFWH